MTKIKERDILLQEKTRRIDVLPAEGSVCFGTTQPSVFLELESECFSEMADEEVICDLSSWQPWPWLRFFSSLFLLSISSLVSAWNRLWAFWQCYCNFTLRWRKLFISLASLHLLTTHNENNKGLIKFIKVWKCNELFLFPFIKR